MGGLISLLEAAESPDRVAALVLVDPALPAWVDVLDPVVVQLFAAYATPGVGEALLDSMRDQDPVQLVDSSQKLEKHRAITHDLLEVMYGANLLLKIDILFLKPCFQRRDLFIRFHVGDR